MRIAFLTTEYPTEATFAGGIASYTHRTACLLRDHGHDVEVFTLSSASDRFDYESIPVHQVKGSARFETSVRRSRILRRCSGYAKVLNRSYALDAALRRRHREHRFDLVQAVSSHACGLLATFRRVAPVVTFMNSYDPAIREAEQRDSSRKQRQMERATFWQMRRSDAIHAPSQLAADLLGRRQHLRARVIEYAYDLSSISQRDWPAPDGVATAGYGLYFGALNRLKGCDRLVDVLSELLRRRREMRFVFVGRSHNTADGVPFDQFIRERLSEFGDRVLALPPQRPESLFRYVAHARFVALPSRTDNLPNTCLEAMSLGRVVIASRDASFEQVIEHGVNGLLVSQSDNHELAGRLQDAWDMSDAERSAIGRAAITSLARFKPDVAIKPLLALYDDVLKGTGRIANHTLQLAIRG